VGGEYECRLEMAQHLDYYRGAGAAEVGPRVRHGHVNVAAGAAAGGVHLCSRSTESQDWVT